MEPNQCHAPSQSEPPAWHPLPSGHGVDIVDLLRFPLVVSRVGEHGDGANAGPTDQNKAKVMRCSLDRTDTAVMLGILGYLGPLATLPPAR